MQLKRDPSFEGILPSGTPVAQCCPVVRELPALTCRTASASNS
jgi:hypothetical protein